MSLPLYKPEEDKPLNRVKHIIAIAAGKGGVGKSTVTANLALALQSQGFKVGILDGDLYGPSIRKMLPEDRPPGKRDSWLIPGLSHGIKVITMAYFREPGEATVVRAPIANNIINQFINGVDWRNLDYLLIDFPPGTGDIQLSLSQHANLTGAIIVTTPQQVAILDVRKAINMFEQLQVPIVGIIENMSCYYHPGTEERICLFGSGGGRSLADETGWPFLGEVPIDPEICRCGDNGKPLPPNSSSAKAFIALAAKAVEEIAALTDADEAFPSIKSIAQDDEHTFKIMWGDGMARSYRLSDLQRECPCAGCSEKKSQVDENVRAIDICNVGRYALKIRFTSGCSSGIYSYEMLRAYTTSDISSQHLKTVRSETQT